MSFPSSPINGQTTTLNGITYIYNATNNAWKRQALTSLNLSGNINVAAVVFPDGSTISGSAVYDLDEIYADGTTNTFAVTYNQANETITNPWSLLVTIDGIFQPAFTENYDTVWLSHALCASRGYTISSGNLKFADPPRAGTTVYARKQALVSNSAARIYPFKPLDIALGI
jgi:hypothetical protein